MKVIEKILKVLACDIEQKKVLEVACGEASFSMAAADVAKEVVGIDIEALRLDRVKELPKNVQLIQHDALEMDQLDFKADVVVCMNGMSHMKEIALPVIVKSLEKADLMLIISTWKLDKNFMIDEIEPLLTAYDLETVHQKQFSIYKIRK